MEVLTIAGVKIDNLSKTYLVSQKLVPVLKNLSLETKGEGITVILGRSGCGKTTLLRIIGGLEPADEGNVSLLGNDKVGIVFQEPRLMPWLTVWKNITFGLRKKEINPSVINQLIDTVGLKGFEKAYPAQLSGGMQQRTALARSLAYDPSLILMDEPFAALDHFTRKLMQEELLRIHQLNHKEILFVTHSIDEAINIGDTIVIIKEGKLACRYDLKDCPFPRNLLSEQLIKMKKEIINHLDE